MTHTIFTSIIKKILLGGIFFLFLFIFSHDVLAVSLENQSSQTSLNKGEELIVNTVLNINATDGTVYYLRGIFYKTGTNNYCGYTWNGSSWFKGPYTTNEDWKNFLSVTVNNDSWNGTIKVKIDEEDPGCLDSGEYKLKIQRFTNGSSSPNTDPQNELTLNVIIPT
ncbi:hypothetical protein COS54_00655, partial [Candidatus Shapirobacteria bacterium CG03_land_8_20_14_0_80_39_12]